MCYVSLAMPSVISVSPLLPHSFYLVATFITLIGALVGAAIPLFYELGAELTYPQPESTSANVTVLLLNAASFLFLFITPSLLHKRVLNIVFLGKDCVLLSLTLS